MITAIASAMTRLPFPFSPRRRRGGLSRWLAAAGIALTLTGCTSRHSLPGVIFIALGVSGDEIINPELLNDAQGRFALLEAAFRQVYPNTSIRFNLYPESKLLAAMRQRTQAGLAPDLLLVNGDTARELLRAGLTVPFPLTAEQSEAFDPDELRRLRTSTGELVGLPLLVQTQMACFNRQRLPSAPATVEELLEISAAGHPIGLPANLLNLFWTAGSLGAIPAINTALEGQPPTPEQRGRIKAWVTWLQEASAQQRVLFYTEQQSAESELISGRLEWIPCRSTMLPRLTRALGSRLGVAPLPNGHGGEASPINRLRVLSIGRNSSRAGHQRLLAFSSFAMNPMIQRNITVGSKTFLPANRTVRVPVLSSSVLAAMVAAEEQGHRSNQTLSAIAGSDPRIGAMQTLINLLVFGAVSPEDATARMLRILQEGR